MARDAWREHDERPSDLAAKPEPTTQAPGRVTLTSQLGRRVTAEAVARQVVQMLGAAPVRQEPDDAHAIADAGFGGGAGELPHLDVVQRAFGRHDVSGVRAHVGGPAADASRELGARAYASGDRVAFAEAPDLFLVAHEAAHVVQQRGGVQLAGGVGAAGDRYEQHADEVAAAVVRGESVEQLLDRDRGGSGRLVQRSPAGAAVQFHDGDHPHPHPHGDEHEPGAAQQTEGAPASDTGWASQWRQAQAAGPQQVTRIKQMIVAAARGLRPQGSRPWAGNELTVADVVPQKGAARAVEEQAATNSRLIFDDLITRPTQLRFWSYVLFQVQPLNATIVRSDRNYTVSALTHELQHVTDLVGDFEGFERQLGRQAQASDLPAWFEYVRGHGGTQERHQEIYEEQGRSGDASSWSQDTQLDWIRGVMAETPPTAGDLTVGQQDSEATVLHMLQGAAPTIPTEARVVSLFRRMDRAHKEAVSGTLRAQSDVVHASFNSRSMEQSLRTFATVIARYNPIWQADAEINVRWRNVQLRSWRGRWRQVQGASGG